MLSLNPLLSTLFRKIGNSYFPVIPTILLNGFYKDESFVPSFNPIDIFENIKLLINQKQTLPMKPFYKNFKGGIELNDDHMITRGLIKEFSNET